MRVTILGASGVAGRQFVPLAQAHGHDVLTKRVDLFDLAALTSYLRGCDAAVNLVTSIPKVGGRGDWAVNDRVRREGTSVLLAAGAAAGVAIVVQQSVAMLHCASDAVPQTEDDPIAGFGAIASAFDMEALCRASPLDVRLVRGGLFYGPGTGREEQWHKEVFDPAFRIPGDGTAWWSPVHVADYASAVLAVLEHGAVRGAYIAAEDAPLQVHELYALLAMDAGVPPLQTGGVERMRSFRVSNARLRGLGWAPAFNRAWRNMSAPRLGA